VIEVKGEENWQQATFAVGKYLTNDLFLRYQKEIGFRETSEFSRMKSPWNMKSIAGFFAAHQRGRRKTTDLILF